MCDVDCNPVRVWWSNRTGQLQRLDPIKPAEKFLKFHWAFARRDGQLGNRLIRKYKLRYYPAEMRDDGSLLRLGNQFETERPAGQPYYELPALTYPQQQSKNYSLQVSRAPSYPSRPLPQPSSLILQPAARFQFVRNDRFAHGM